MTTNKHMDKTVLYAAQVSCLADPALYAKAYSLASPARKAKTDRFRFPRDRYLSLGAELLLRYGLQQEGLDLPELSYGAQEKPYLQNGGLFFNLSHSGEYALCAISPQEVGCDIEKMAPVHMNIAGRFFSGTEYEDIASKACGAERSALFFRYWTLKESFMKATGLGMKLPLNAFAISLGEEITVLQTVNDLTYSFKEFSNIPGYKCAVCTVGDCCRAELRIADISEWIEVIL